MHKIAPRGIYTSGKGSSAVGLTAYVTRDPDTKQLVLERYDRLIVVNFQFGLIIVNVQWCTRIERRRSMLH